MNLLIFRGKQLGWPLILLVFAMTTSVFTSLRFITGVGVSELIILFLGALVFIGRISKPEQHGADKRLFAYFKGVAFTIPLGIAWNLMTVHSTFQMVHDLLAFCLAWYLTFFVLDNLVQKKCVYEIIYLFILFGFIADLWYLRMYHGGAGFFFDTERFCGYSTDPNQIAEAIILIPWLGLLFIEYVKKEKMPAFYTYGAIAAIILSIHIGNITDSDAYIAANLAACCTWAFAAKALSGKSWPFFVIIFGVLVYLLWQNNSLSDLYDKIQAYYKEVAEKDNQMDTRINVWKYGIEAFFHSPIFGNGPGAHSGNWFAFGKIESHNTYVYILMDHGLIGFCLLVSYLIKVGKKIISSHSAPLSACLAGLLVFCFFHSFQRMPLFWFYLCLINSLAEHKVSNYTN